MKDSGEYDKILARLGNNERYVYIFLPAKTCQ